MTKEIKENYTYVIYRETSTNDLCLFVDIVCLAVTTSNPQCRPLLNRYFALDL